MALEKRSVAIPLGAGTQEGTNSKLLDAPSLGDLSDARWDKRGELTKRFGAKKIDATGIADGVDPVALFTHAGTLVQYGTEGAHVYDPVAKRWNQWNVSGPRPCSIETDRLVRGNGTYLDADIAYDDKTGIACVVYRDDDANRIASHFIDTATGVTIASAVQLPSTMLTEPKVVFFNGHFLAVAFGTLKGDVIASWYDPSQGDFAWHNAVTIHDGTTSTDVAFDVCVASADEVYCHVAVARTTSGWVSYQVDKTGIVNATQIPGSGGGSQEPHSIAVFHSPDQKSVYLLYENRAVSPEVLSIDVFPDSYEGTRTQTKVLDFEVNTSEVGRRVTLAPKGKSDLWCFCSHGKSDGGKLGGVEFRAVTATGSTSGSKQMVPGVILSTKAFQDTKVRTVVGVSRELQFNPLSTASDNELYGNYEPLPSGFLVTPVEVESGSYTFATLGRFGHDTIAHSQAHDQTGTYLGSIASVGSEGWAAYRVSVSANPGTIDEDRSANLGESLEYGWRYGLDLMRAQLDPVGVARSSAEGLSLQAGGVLASFDGIYSTELSIPVVPHKPFWSHSLGSSADGAAGTDYALAASWSNENGTGYEYTIARMSFKYLFRWVDESGQVHRSALSEPMHRLYQVDHNGKALGIPAGDGANPSLADDGFLHELSQAITGNSIDGWDGVTQYTRIIFIPKPTPTALRGDTPANIQVELYRTAVNYTQYQRSTDADTYPNTTVQSETKGAEDAAYRLVGILEIGDVTGNPNLGWVEDPIQAASSFPTADAPTPYTDSVPAELSSEPTPPLLDICSTQQRLFAINAEDRLEVRFSKPFVAGLAPEWNAANALRCAAEGGDLVACEVVDDKLVLFKEGRIYVVPVFSGPDATGAGSAFLSPRQIAADTGCINRRSVAAGPFGIVFQSERGLALIDRGLSLRFVGEAVKDTMSGRTIVRATVVPYESEVRFMLDASETGPTAVVWNYWLDQWSTWENVDCVDSALWQGRQVRLQTDGTLHQETDGLYDEAVSGTRPMLSVTTPWIKLAGLQGFQRVWSASILGEYVSGDLTVDIGYNYDNVWTDTRDFTESDLLAMSRFQLRVRPTRQKCQAIRFRVREREIGTPTTGAGFKLQGLQLEVGMKRGSFKLMSADSKA